MQYINSYIKKFMTFILSFRKMQKKVLFESFCGKQYSADPRAISEKLHEQHPDIQIVWYISSPYYNQIADYIPKYVRVIKSKFEFIDELSTCSAYVTTEPLLRSFYKRKGMFVVQTWHGDRGFKKILYDASASVNKKRTLDKIYDNKYTDICVAGSDFGERVYRKSFHYYGKVIKCGMPRNDKLMMPQQNLSHEIKRRLNIKDDTKVLLYAPTFRGHSPQEQESQFDICHALDVLEQNTEKWVCIIRSHIHAKRLITSSRNDDRILDLSTYYDIADLLLVTDILITDYSSCSGDFVLCDKPIICLVNDLEEYKTSSRDLVDDIFNFGFVLSHNEKELLDLLSNRNSTLFHDSVKKAKKYYGVCESGHSSETICNLIYDSINKNINKSNKT